MAAMPDSAVASSLEAEADLQSNLEVCNLTFHNMTARPSHFEPVDVTQRLAGDLDGLSNGIVRPGGRRADEPTSSTCL